MTIKMEKQQSPKRSSNKTEHSCKVVVKKHSCSNHTTNRCVADEIPRTGKKSTNSIAKDLCPCNTCSCDKCPDVLQLLNKPICNKGIEDLFPLCPKSAELIQAACSKTCTEVIGPKPIELDMITYDDECTCELIARAIRADVHRYLSLVDRGSKTKPDSKADFSSCPECAAKSSPKSTSKSCPICKPESIPNSNPKPKMKIKFSDSDIEDNLSTCQQPENPKL